LERGLKDDYTISRSVPSIEPSPIFETYIGLGSNLGDKRQNIEKAIELLNETPKVKVCRVSNFYETAPVGYEAQPDFLNAAAKVETTLTPQEFLEVCQDIEGRLKRVKSIRWGPRTIDIDILIYGDLILKTEDLTIPHPEMHKREFVLKPLSDIAPEAVHPVSGKTIEQLYNGLCGTRGQVHCPKKCDK
jgi:2-amino-4-hydroxy-6-hydroxymethyldihydropteridine diphosphokinase